MLTGVELTKDKPSYTWSFTEEEDDEDFLVHTLFLKTAVLGTSAVKGERNIVYIETKNFDKKDVKQPLFSLTLGQLDMCSLDISFGIETEVTFRLAEGSGPVALGGQHLIEFPGDDDDFSQDESALDEDDLTEEDSPKKGAKKRKAATGADKKSKKGKMEESMSSVEDSLDDEEDDDEEDDVEDEDEDEDMEEEEEKGKKKGAKGKKGPKTTKVSPKKAAKKTTKKAKK